MVSIPCDERSLLTMPNQMFVRGTPLLYEGQLIARKYEVIRQLGEGWEGQVYLVRERATHIERAVKVFFPQRNIRERAAKHHARKLHALRHCPIAIQYHAQETITRGHTPLTLLVSEFVEGELLSEFIARQRGGRLSVFQGVHLLHALASGLECIHNLREYHGDLHTDNIIVQRFGLGFDLRILDFMHWKAPKRESVRDDVVDMVKIFHEAIGGHRFYSKQPRVAKQICRGLKRKLILERYRTAGQLRAYLENMEWE